MRAVRRKSNVAVKNSFAQLFSELLRGLSC